jgi:hypothetical protein
MKMKSLLLTAIATLGITAASTAQNVPSYIPTDGLVGWWPFNGNANDESGNGYNGNVSGSLLTSDRFNNSNNAYNFDGVDDYILASPVLPIGSAPRTVSSWFRTTAGTIPSSQYPNIQFITGWGNAFSGAVIFPQHVQAPSGRAYFESGSSANQLFSENAVNNGQWHHFITTYDGPSSRVKIYIDGILEDSSATLNLTTANSNFGIGNAPWANIPFNGQIDDIAIWNRALTPQEISALYTASSTNNNEASNTTANVPGAISYQAVARDTQGSPLADTNVQVQFTLIADSLSGAEEYVETHTLTTNSLGLFTTAFGGGTPVSNSFDSINWSAGNKFLNVQIDTGNGLVDIGTQQLLSTPYSLHSATAGAIKNPGLPIYSDNAAALAGGLSSGDMYRTGAGVLMVVY